MRHRPPRVALAVVAALALGACTSYADLRITPVGRFDFEGGANPNPALVGEELSGLAHWRGDTYIAVSDEHACAHVLRIRVDPDSGGIVSAAFEGAIPLFDAKGVSLEDGHGPSDREGVAIDTTAGLLWISHEDAGPGRDGPAIAAYGLDDGRLRRDLDPENTPLLGVFARMRSNRGFESLTRRADGSEAWTANEEALTVDGPGPSAKNGTLVRLVRMDGAFHPIAQYAYEVDSLDGPITFPPQLAGLKVSGVSDLLALPDGSLLVLEREFGAVDGGFPSNRIRIYAADWKNATDVSKGALATGLEGRTFKPVKKTRLVELTFPLSNSNFEGIALGPRLANGDWSLLLVADNQAGTMQALYALRLSGLK